MRIPEIELSIKNCFKQLPVSMKLFSVKTMYKYLALFLFMAFSNTYLIGQIDFEILSGDANICAGDSTLLSIDATVDSIQWSPTTGVSMPNSLSTFVSPTQSTTYFATLFSEGMTTNVRFEVDVFSAPVLGNDITVCGVSILNFDLSDLPNPTQYSLFSNGVFTMDQTSPNVFTVLTDVPNPGTFELIASSICGQTDTIQVTVLEGTPAFISLNGDDVTICPGDEVNFNVTSPIGNPGIEWFANGTSISTANAISENPTTTTTYVVEASDAGCAVPTRDSVTVTVNLPPAVSLPEMVQGCENDIITLGNNIAQANTTYNWLPDDNIIDPSVVNAELLVVENGTYVLTASNGCTIQDTIAINLIPNDIEIEEDTLFLCKGDSITITWTTNPPNDAVVWTDIAGVPLSNVGNPFIVSPQDVVTFVGTVENNGCTFSDTVTIQVDSLPVFPDLELIELDMMPPICEGDTVLLQDDPIFAPNLYPNLTFQWFTGDSTMIPALPGQLDGFLTPDSLLQVLFLGTMSQPYNRLNINGACTSISSIDVEVIPILEIDITPLDEVCPGESFTLFGTPFDPDTGEERDPDDLDEWDWMTSSGTIEPADDPQPLLTVGQEDANINVSAMYMGCPAMGMATIPVITPPVVILTALTNRCPGDNVFLNSNIISDPNGYTFTWTSTSATDGLAGQENLPNPQVNPIEDATYTVTVSNGICDDIFQEVTINIFDQADALQNPIMAGACQGETITLTIEDQNLNGGPNPIYTWTPQSGGAPLTGATVSFTGQQNEIFIITVSNDCVDDQLVGQAIVTVQQRPTVNIVCDPDLTSYAEGSEIVLNVDPLIEGVTYTWSSLNGGVFSVNPSSSTVYTATSTGQGLDIDFDSIFVSAEIQGCISSDDIVKRIEPANVMLPNIFTPGLTENNVFRIRVNGEGLVTVTNLQIYDRWGNKVYDNDNDAQEWDGNIDGQPAPSDVYIYTVTYEIPGQDPITDSSDLTLLR